MEAGERQIRAVYTKDTVRVYQAYGRNIAEEAVKKGTFGENFKMGRMTWIKPSFLWMMYLSLIQIYEPTRHEPRTYAG